MIRVGSLLAFLLVITWATLAKDQALQKDSITVEINKNLEFLGYALYISEPDIVNDEFGDLFPIRQFLNQQRQQFQEDSLLNVIFEMGEEFDYTFFIELFLIMDDLPHKTEFVIPENFLTKHHLNHPQDRTFLADLLDKINFLYQKTEFDSFWSANQHFYDDLLAKTEVGKPSDTLLNVMENFYNKDFLTYKIVPSLTFWSAGFGFEFEEDQTALFAFGTLGNPNSFDQNFFQTLTIHEFGHSFANSQLELCCSDLIEETRPLYAPIKYSMTTQGYPNWLFCVNEHFVRAGEVLIPEIMNEKGLSKRNLAVNKGTDFKYLAFIVDKLREYRIRKGLTFQQSLQKTMNDLKDKYL